MNVATLAVRYSITARELGATEQPPATGPYIEVLVGSRVFYWRVVPGAMKPLPEVPFR